MHKGKCNEYASVNIVNNFNFYLQGLYMAIFIQLTHTLTILFVSPTLSRFHWPIITSCLLVDVWLYLPMGMVLLYCASP
jgi:hypothetical protein